MALPYLRLLVVPLAGLLIRAAACTDFEPSAPPSPPNDGGPEPTAALPDATTPGVAAGEGGARDSGSTFCDDQPDALMCADFDEPILRRGFDFETSSDGGTIGTADEHVSPPHSLLAQVSAYTAPDHPFAQLVRSIPSRSFRLSFDFRIDSEVPPETLDIGGLMSKPPYYVSLLRFRAGKQFWQMFEYGDALSSDPTVNAVADTVAPLKTAVWTHVDMDYDFTPTSSTVAVSMNGVQVLEPHALSAHRYPGARNVELGARTEGTGGGASVLIDNVVATPR